jgi:hypothetical protein
MFGMLTFDLKVKLDDFEIVFGKDSVDDETYKFYIIDFDRCFFIEDMEEEVKDFIKNPDTPKYMKYLGRMDYFNFSKLKESYKENFKNGYLSIAKKYGFSAFASAIIENIK